MIVSVVDTNVARVTFPAPLSTLQTSALDPQNFQKQFRDHRTHTTHVYDLPRTPMMAEAFLNQILVAENRVESEGIAQCCVCLQRYGALTDTGAIECEIRLPCKHSLGSMCAFTLLKCNNAGPFCRKELYTTQIHPSLKNRIMRGTALIFESSNQDEQVSQIYRRQCESFHTSLISTLELPSCRSISPAVARTVHRMARRLETWGIFAGEAPSRLAAVCLYMASYINNEILPSEKIHQATGIGLEEVHSTYSRIYPGRARLIDMEIIDIIDQSDLNSVLASFLL